MTVEANLPIFGVCYPWAEPADIPNQTVVAQMDPDVVTNSLLMASNVLYFLSAKQFAGSCEDTVRPCARILGVDHGRPIRNGMPWWNGIGGSLVGYYIGIGSGQGWCLFNQVEEPDGNLLPSINLGVYPLTGISYITIDGEVIDPTTYRIDNWRSLVRLADPVTTTNPGWPYQQRMDLTPDQPGTFEIQFAYGNVPDQGGVMACAELGYQIALSQSPNLSATCQLPARVRQITRQGVSAMVLDPMDFLDRGKTGLLLCDYWLSAVNKYGLTRRARVLSPDIGPRVRHTGPVG